MIYVGSVHTGPDQYYRGVSPQLLARVRQNWSALGLDLDAIWHSSVRSQPGFGDLRSVPSLADSRPVDLLLLFDQGCAWVDVVRHMGHMLLDRREEGRLTEAQLRGLVAVTTRLREELAAVRMLAIEGLATPAMQISRSISEDVDLALLIQIRRKVAQKFVDCGSPEAASAFWRTHVAGGRAFRTVSQALYRFGLDFSDDSDYARWRKEVLVFLGSVVHTSFVGSPTAGDRGGPLSPMAQECLYFTTVRLQELCAYSLVLGQDLRADIASLETGPGLPELRCRFILTGGDIIVDQMRWLTCA